MRRATGQGSFLSSFDDLLQAARQQPEPQRLLFVFTRAELPEDCTPEQRARFEAGLGGALTPLMSVDKAPEEIRDFQALVEESRQFGVEWSVVFVAALSGSGDAEQAIERMIASIKAGSPGALIPFDRQGQALSLG
jgi:hypothetical protein